MNQHRTLRTPASLTKQAGAATLLTAVVILMLATVLIVAVSRTTIMEQRISGNEIRSRQASEAAEAGLNCGLAYLAKSPLAANPACAAGAPAGVAAGIGADKDNNDVADTMSVVTLTASTSNKYSMSFCNPTTPLANISCPAVPNAVICPAAPATYLNTPRIVSCGWSDDGLGRAMISQGVGTVGGLAKGPTNPLTAKGTVNVSGSATVTNYYNNLTVWSGGSLSDIGNSGKTFVRNPTVPPPAASVAPPAPPTGGCTSSSDYVCATDKNTTGPDVIDSDPTLSNLTDAQLFTNYFGVANLAAYQASIATMPNVAPGDAGTLSGVKGQAIVVTGDLTSSMSFTIGSRDRPVVLVINGNWSGGGNTTIYGVVYVTGNMDLQGSKTIYGGVVIEGNVSGTGSLDVIYDPLVTANAAANVGKGGTIPGSWRDWK